MCFLLQVFNYFRIRLKFKTYLRKKALAKIGIDHEQDEELRNLKSRIQTLYRRKKGKFKKGLLRKISSSKTFENHVLLAVIGWFIGTIYTFLHFYFEIYMGEATVFWSVLVHLPLLVFITVCVAFTEMGRCYVMLTPLEIFSIKGQVYIAGLVTILVMEGPVANLKYNLSVIKESGTCQQREISVAAAEVADIRFGPFSSFKQVAKDIIDGIKTMVEKLQNMLGSFKRTVLEVADAIEGAMKWINSKIYGCKKSVGTTYDHCIRAFAWVYDECKVSVPSVLANMCVATEFASNICSSVKPGEYLCDLVYFSIDPLMTTVNQRMNRLWDRAYALMYFDVNIHHEYSFFTHTKSIAEELKNEKNSTIFMVILESIFYFLLAIFKVLLRFSFLKAVYDYRSSYFRDEKFDNYIISDKLKSVDLVESMKGPESIFPLRRVERRKYIHVSSFRLVKNELKVYSYPSDVLVKSVVILIIIGGGYLLSLVTEKCRVFMLAVMQTFGSRPEINIVGSGFISELARQVQQSFSYSDYNFFYEHFMQCLPNPKRPSKWTNFKIICLLVLLSFSWVIKPYVLRFRHKVMDYYEPTIADKRARWLYKKIYFSRFVFIKLIRIKLRAKYGRRETNLTLADKLRARYPWLTDIIGKGVMIDECMICNHLKPPLYLCPTLNCHGIYCDDCYVVIRGVCPLCKQNMMLDDFKHLQFKVLEEEDSSDEEEFMEDEGIFLIKNDEGGLDFSYQRGFADVPNIPEFIDYIDKDALLEAAVLFEKHYRKDDGSEDSEYSETYFSCTDIFEM